jgi:hypothetical protein
MVGVVERLTVGVSAVPATPEPSLPASICRDIDPPCDAFEARWQQGEPPAIEDYLGAVSGAAQSLLLEELIRTDLEWRCLFASITSTRG